MNADLTTTTRLRFEDKVQLLLKAKERGQSLDAYLDKSKSLKNPYMYLQLLQHLGLSAQQEYASTQPPFLNEDAGFPRPSAFYDQLDAVQRELMDRKQREAVRIAQGQLPARSGVSFVPSSATSGTMK